MKELEDKLLKKQRDPDFIGAEVAMNRAAERAHHRAAESGGTVAVFRNGKIVYEQPVKETSA
jgi:hypothetical protein